MPKWLAYSVAFFAPFFSTLAASWASTDRLAAMIIALSAGFGGLAGIGTNQQINAGYKKRAGQDDGE